MTVEVPACQHLEQRIPSYRMHSTKIEHQIHQKIYFLGNVWQLLESISNNILMVNLLMIFHLKIDYPLQINWIKGSCSIEWE